jgi:hypothetical protein
VSCELAAHSRRLPQHPAKQSAGLLLRHGIFDDPDIAAQHSQRLSRLWLLLRILLLLLPFRRDSILHLHLLAHASSLTSACQGLPRSIKAWAIRRLEPLLVAQEYCSYGVQSMGISHRPKLSAVKGSARHVRDSSSCAG